MENHNKIDERGRLEEQPFDYRITKDQKVLIRWNGRLIMTLSEKKATKLIASLKNADEREAQLLLAKATGHFKHGNERRGKSN